MSGFPVQSSRMVIAIDGPAASGKSSVARGLASRLGIVYVNSGAMYRAFTWYLNRTETDPRDFAKVLEQLRQVEFKCSIDGGESVLSLNGEDPGPYLSSPQVNRDVSVIATIPEVREFMVQVQRDCANGTDLVMEGRDIGSVVFPDTPWKFYIDASPEVRARRRSLQGLHDEIGVRDQRDSSRVTSPLVIAADAVLIDSSDLTIEGVIEAILEQIRRRGEPVPV